MLQGLTFIPQDKPALRAMHVRWVQAMPFSMKCHLTYNSDLRSDLQVSFTTSATLHSSSS